MAAVNLERGVRIGIIGGIGDKTKDLNRNAQPLVDAGFQVISVDGGWTAGERTRNKIARIRRFLDEKQPTVLFGPSVGGLLAVVAGFNHPSVQRIVTASTPLRWPSFRENTPKLRAIETALPSLWGLKRRYDKEVRDNLGTTHQHFLHFRGKEDEIVPPSLSWMTGADDGMTHIEHEIYPTPSRQDRGKEWAHTFNTQGVFHLSRFQEFVAGKLAVAA